MVAELTNEEIVTKLLSFNEIIKTNNRSFFITNPSVSNLGSFLKEIRTTEGIYTQTKINTNNKYHFIKY